MKQRKPQGNQEYPFRDTVALNYGIAASIKAYMRRNGITIKQLGQHVKRFSYASLVERLNGNTGMYIEDYLDICHALGVLPTEFLPTADEMTEHFRWA